MENRANDSGGNRSQINTVSSTNFGIFIVLALQFVGLVVWAVTEHVERTQLKHDFDTYVAVHSKQDEITSIRLDMIPIFAERQVAIGSRMTGLDERITGMVIRMNSLSDRITEVANRIDRLHPPTP